MGYSLLGHSLSLSPFWVGKWDVGCSLVFYVHFPWPLYSQKLFQNNQKGFVAFSEIRGHMVSLLCVSSAFDCRELGCSLPVAHSYGE